MVGRPPRLRQLSGLPLRTGPGLVAVSRLARRPEGYPTHPVESHEVACSSEVVRLRDPGADRRRPRRHLRYPPARSRLVGDARPVERLEVRAPNPDPNRDRWPPG